MPMMEAMVQVVAILVEEETAVAEVVGAILAEIVVVGPEVETLAVTAAVVKAEEILVAPVPPAAEPKVVGRRKRLRQRLLPLPRRLRQAFKFTR
jgi:hypothetical protein